MLPFGSLLTQLPLLVIGALYMLYLGFYAVNRTKDAPLAADTEKREQVVESKALIAETDYFTLVSLTREKDRDASPSENIIHFIVTRSFLPYQVSDFEIINSYSGYCLFSRPPPAVV
ncbi:MAG: hypothetical protein HZB98_14855 [Bacteroidia bacterium]|nr:hypothetical protein [Bacteroidia bacterium]